MILIFGGAYQGKLEYGLKTFDVSEEDVCYCDMGEAAIALDKKVINDMDKFVFACIKEGVNARDYLEDNLEKLRDKILIFNDISQGVVPVDETERAWREMTGRCMTFLAGEADQVFRVFCGIGSRVK